MFVKQFTRCKTALICTILLLILPSYGGTREVQSSSLLQHGNSLQQCLFLHKTDEQKMHFHLVSESSSNNFQKAYNILARMQKTNSHLRTKSSAYLDSSCYLNIRVGSSVLRHGYEEHFVLRQNHGYSSLNTMSWTLRYIPVSNTRT